VALIIPTEGLDYMAALVLEGSTSPATLHLGLFTGGDGTTVPAASATRATMGGAFAEAATGSTYPGYATQSVTANTDWGTIGAQTVWGNTVRGAVGTQKSFPAATAAAGSANITGFFIATHATTGIVLLYSNFVGEASAVIASLALGDIVRVTPTFGFMSAVEV
jgi:hypothetical protein